MRFSKELYSKAALLKAAFSFVDRAYVHLDSDDSDWIVELSDKKDRSATTLDDFANELITQSVREVIYERTKVVRELLVARTVASSVVGHPEPPLDEEAVPFGDPEVEDALLSDWFDE